MQFKAASDFIMKKLRKGLPEYLSYHSIAHIKDVYQAADMLADAERIKGEDKKLLLTAALFHDSGFLIQQKEHERISCDIAAEFLPSYGYSEEQIKKISGMIMATKIPQTPHNLLEEIICDADLDYLGRDDFFKIGDTLYAELNVYSFMDEDKWNRLQIDFMEKHHYFTATAQKLRKAKKEQNLELVRSKLQAP
jgi:predicted metal-dependent HD superfamily phosphohydrolase